MTVMTHASRIRRRLGDVMLSVAGLAVVLGALMAFDPRIREQVTNTKAASSGAVDLGSRFIELARTLVQIAVDQSETHPSLTVFAIAATVLVVFMLRT
jgi:hypothetical protein